MFGINICILGAALMIIGSMDDSPTMEVWEMANPKLFKFFIGAFLWFVGFCITAYDLHKAEKILKKTADVSKKNHRKK